MYFRWASVAELPHTQGIHVLNFSRFSLGSSCSAGRKRRCVGGENETSWSESYLWKVPAVWASCSSWSHWDFSQSILVFLTVFARLPCDPWWFFFKIQKITRNLKKKCVNTYVSLHIRAPSKHSSEKKRFYRRIFNKSFTTINFGIFDVFCSITVRSISERFFFKIKKSSKMYVCEYIYVHQHFFWKKKRFYLKDFRSLHKFHKVQVFTNQKKLSF